MQQPYKITYKIVVLYRGKKDMIRGHPIILLFVLFFMPPTHFDATGSSSERNN